MPAILRQPSASLSARPRAGGLRGALAPATIGLMLLLCLALPGRPHAQTLSAPAPTDSVVSRLVAWRATSQAPVRLPTLTEFEWDRFAVVAQPAGDALVNCGRAGLMPCSPDVAPPADRTVQVLEFRNGGVPVYQERIMTESGAFAEPLPRDVPPEAATLVSCPGPDGRALWCLQGDGRARRPDRYLDGG